MNLNKRTELVSQPITNQIKNQYVTNSNVWSVDETFFNKNQVLFLVINNKTRAIIGFIYKKASVESISTNKPIYCNSDNILCLYEKLVNQYASPKIIHCDSNPTYVSKNIQKFCEDEEITLSTTESKPKNNQVIEAVNNAIKINIVFIISKIKRPHQYREWHNAFYKNDSSVKSPTARSTNANYRKELFTSELFLNLQNLENYILESVQLYNQNLSNIPELNYKKITRGEFEYLNTFIYVTHFKQTSSTTSISNLIQKDNAAAVIKVKTLQKKIKESKYIPDEYKEDILNNIVVPQDQKSLVGCVNELTQYIDPSNKEILKTLKLLAYQAAENTNLLL